MSRLFNRTFVKLPFRVLRILDLQFSHTIAPIPKLLLRFSSQLGWKSQFLCDIGRYGTDSHTHVSLDTLTDLGFGVKTLLRALTQNECSCIFIAQMSELCSAVPANGRRQL
jgi:hypothetical protein